MPDFGRSRNDGPSLDAVLRSDQFIEALAAGRPVAPQDDADAALARMLEGWRDETRWPPATGLISEPQAIAALRAGVDAKQTTKRSRRGLSIVGAAAAAVLCIGGFGAVLAGSGPGDALYGLRTMLFGEPQRVRDDHVVLAAKTEMQQVQELIAQGDWQQAEAKLVAVNSQVKSLGDEQQKQQLLEQWNELSAKVVQKDPEATVPPGITYTVPPSATELMPAVVTPGAGPEVPPSSVPGSPSITTPTTPSESGASPTPSEGSSTEPTSPTQQTPPSTITAAPSTTTAAPATTTAQAPATSSSAPTTSSAPATTTAAPTTTAGTTPTSTTAAGTTTTSSAPTGAATTTTTAVVQQSAASAPPSTAASASAPVVASVPESTPAPVATVPTAVATVPTAAATVPSTAVQAPKTPPRIAITTTMAPMPVLPELGGGN